MIQVKYGINGIAKRYPYIYSGGNRVVICKKRSNHKNYIKGNERMGNNCGQS